MRNILVTDRLSQYCDLTITMETAQEYRGVVTINKEQFDALSLDYGAYMKHVKMELLQLLMNYTDIDKGCYFEFEEKVPMESETEFVYKKFELRAFVTPKIER